jgi:hypothetical protein
MISSAPRLNVLGEFVTKAIITFESTPDSASLIISDTGLAGRIFGGNGFSVDTDSTGASAMSGTSEGSTPTALLASAPELVVTDPTSVLVSRKEGWAVLEGGSTHPPAIGMDTRIATWLHFHKNWGFIQFSL